MKRTVIYKSYDKSYSGLRPAKTDDKVFEELEKIALKLPTLNPDESDSNYFSIPSQDTLIEYFRFFGSEGSTKTLTRTLIIQYLGMELPDSLQHILDSHKFKRAERR